MKRLVVVAVVLLLATAVGAAVLVQQGYYDLNNLRFTDKADGFIPTTSNETVAAASAAATPTSTKNSQSEPKATSETAKVAAVDRSPRVSSQGNATPRAGTSADGLAFDIARIQPDGISVFAGQGKPRQFVRVLADGELVGTAKVDENGEWVLITERKLASNDPKLSLEVGEAPSQDATSEDNKPAQMAAVQNTTSVTDASKQPPDARKTGQTARDVNEEMLSNLQRLVDDARESETSAPASKDVEQANAASEKSEAVGASEEGGRGSPQDEASAVAGPDAKDEPTKLAAMSDDQPARAPTSLTEDKTIPIPIQFVYREATFTPDGEKAADLLLEYLKRRKLNTVTLSGHADERGTPELNMELSMDRLKAVENYLRAGGFTGELLLLPKGKTEPFTGVDRSGFSREDLYQLDRRVELRLSN